MGNSQQKEQIEQFHQQKLVQIQSRFNQDAQTIYEKQNSRMIRSHSTPASSQFKPKINHIAVINNQNSIKSIPTQSCMKITPRSHSLFKPVLKQIIIQSPIMQTPVIKLKLQHQNPTYQSAKTISSQIVNQTSQLQNTSFNKSNQSYTNYNQVSPLNFHHKKQQQDETNQSISAFEINKSDKKNDENQSPFKKDQHLRVDQLLQAIQPNQKQFITQKEVSQNNLLELNFNSLKPMSAQVQSQDQNQVIKLQKILNAQDVPNSSQQNNKNFVRFQDEYDKLQTPVKQKTCKQDTNLSAKGLDKSNESHMNSLSIKEQFEYFDNLLTKQLSYSQSKNQKAQIKSILAQQDSENQKQELEVLEKQNDEEHKYSKSVSNFNISIKNSPNNFNKDQEILSQQNFNLPASSKYNQGSRLSTQQYSSNMNSSNYDAACRESVQEKAPQSCYQSEIKRQDQIEESSFFQQISILNQKMELGDQIMEQKRIQSELIKLQQQQQQNLQLDKQKIQHDKNQENKLITKQDVEAQKYSSHAIQSKNQLRMITNQSNFCSQQTEKNKHSEHDQQLIQGNHQLKTIAHLPEGQTYYYLQPQGGILYQKKQNSPIKYLKEDLRNTHSLDAELISPTNNQIQYQRSQSPISNQLELPVSFTHKDNHQSGQLNNNSKDLKKQEGKESQVNLNDIGLSSNLSVKNNPQDYSYQTDIDNVRMASVKMATNTLSPINNTKNEIYYHQPEWNTKESDKIFQQNIQNKILDARLKEDDSTAPQTPPKQNLNQVGQNNNLNNNTQSNQNNSSVSSAYTFNQKAYENRQEKHPIKHFTLKIDSFKKEIINTSDHFTDSGICRESTLNFTEQKTIKKDSLQENQQETSISQNYSPSSLQKKPSNLVKQIENIQDNVRRSIIKSKELNEVLSQTLNATSLGDNKKVTALEGQDEIELEPFPEDLQNDTQNNNYNINFNLTEKSPVRNSKIKIYHGKIEHIKLNQDQQPENLILYKLDEQLNALIPVVIENNVSELKYIDNNIMTHQKTQETRADSIFSNFSPIKSYQDLLKEQTSGSKTKQLNTSNKKSNTQDKKYQRSSSVDKYSASKQKPQSSFNMSKQQNEIKYFQHQVNPGLKDNAYHQVLLKYSDKMLNEITKSIFIPNSYQQQHLNQRIYKQKQQNSNYQPFLSSSKKQKFI
ncbi:hypothetical protein TTHERM_00697440 (macronuclear) [Tetrahymena thermophila SB210]|uniref:Uncharacterized protein n=1 Tax=Tetrahymena thermophila (strain SB210) TaxID=312017 RepID=Q24C32_TETTS|nr:hypothetical protein TTHERM_00697440 [Tetrahymena thermophila SB210]EAS05406.1 hypothetical protein TTHERM_00697440 [Tetrahymena thermophila SB210]|eukprot:XP_001025651.1 hypothetical protein TTHERM_00697440 [Tetrahymena thermophila SB210]